MVIVVMMRILVRKIFYCGFVFIMFRFIEMMLMIMVLISVLRIELCLLKSEMLLIMVVVMDCRLYLVIVEDGEIELLWLIDI